MTKANEPAPRVLPEWAHWEPSAPYRLGMEEEAMLLDPLDWSLAGATDDLLTRLPPAVTAQMSAETHDAALELTTAPHASAAEVQAEAARLRDALRDGLEAAGLRAAVSGTHPFAVWHDVHVSRGARQQLVYASMRELARREPTFALHVHVGVRDAEAALHLLNQVRAHVPLLLALSSNSPYWQGRDSGLASVRTPIFQAFPRVGIPRAFVDYTEYVGVIDELIRCEAIPEPTFLWWDVRLQPRFGTVEMRIMDAQTTVARSGGLAALVQAIAHLELEEGYHGPALVHAQEILDENRFLAARDGMDAQLIDPVAEHKVPAREWLADLLQAVRPHAQELGCEPALECVQEIAALTGAEWQRRHAHGADLPHLVAVLSDAF